MKFLEEAPLSGKRVLIRVVADVPLETRKKEVVVADDFRLRQLLPTLHYLLDYGARVILISHLGRPGGKVDMNLSLRPVWQHLAGLLRRPIQFAPTIQSQATAEAAKGLKDGEILALENLRFEPGEEKDTRTFALSLARLGDLYVNEAFAVSHHQAASLCEITGLLPSYGGLLLEREVEMLSSLMRHPAKPFVAVVGGAKISDKLPAIKQLLQLAEVVLVGGGVANTLLAASGVAVKDSLVDRTNLKAASQLLKIARGRLIMPTDFIWSKDAIMDIGPQTRQAYSRHLQKAQTAFWSGPVGKVEEKKYQAGSAAIAKAIIDSGATSVAGGGDTVAFLEEIEVMRQFSFISTGGGATLEYLGGQVLPGLKALG
jgi:3-phosphoglycerate kinase